MSPNVFKVPVVPQWVVGSQGPLHIHNEMNVNGSILCMSHVDSHLCSERIVSRRQSVSFNTVHLLFLSRLPECFLSLRGKDIEETNKQNN